MRHINICGVCNVLMNGESSAFKILSETRKEEGMLGDTGVDWRYLQQDMQWRAFINVVMNFRVT